MFLESWGATPEEVASPLVGDHLCDDARVSATRCITIAAPPADVFPWIRQMGFGRAGWYSYDWIDNLGRKSARRIHPEWQDIVSGSLVPAGPMSFIASVVEEPRAFVLTISDKGLGKRMCFTLAYELRPDDLGTRLVTRMRARIDLPGGRLLEKSLLAPGDGIMLRKQLLTLKATIERSRQN
ncbi:MAG: hypothetical protein ACO3JF_07975 [Ilumatobacteraceae bacterium]